MKGKILNNKENKKILVNPLRNEYIAKLETKIGN